VDVRVLKPGSEPVAATVTRDTDGIVDAVKTFVDNFNTMVGQIKTLTKFDPNTNARGVLQGTSTVLRVDDRLSALVTRLILPPGNSIRSLVDVGVRVNSDGKLSLDENKLRTVVEANPQQVSSFFTTAEAGFGAVAQAAIKSFTDPFTGSLSAETTRLQESVDRYQTRIDTLNAILDVRQQRLVEQFANLENILGLLQTQQDQVASIAPLVVQRIGRGAAS
jgi:flagellar hook-associated protein 2